MKGEKQKIEFKKQGIFWSWNSRLDGGAATGQAGRSRERKAPAIEWEWGSENREEIKE